jgi:hypothetical protein
MPWTLRIGGYPLAADDPPTVNTGGTRAAAECADGLVSAVVGLAGLGGLTVVERVGVNAFGRCSAVPVVHSPEPVRPGRVYAAAVVLGAAPVELPEVVIAAGARVTVRWREGVTDRVSLDPPRRAHG